MLPPPVPEVEQRPHGKRHSPERDKRSVQFHYDVSNEFFKLFLDESLTYSCAFFSLDDSSLEAAQFAKLELVCKKLRLSAACGCSTSAAAGAASPCTRRASTA